MAAEFSQLSFLRALALCQRRVGIGAYSLLEPCMCCPLGNSHSSGYSSCFWIRKHHSWSSSQQVMRAGARRCKRYDLSREVIYGEGEHEGQKEVNESKMPDDGGEGRGENHSDLVDPQKKSFSERIITGPLPYFQGLMPRTFVWQ